MLSNQRQIIEQTKFTYSPLEKAFEKQTKTIEEQSKKMDAITNQKKRLVALTNKGDDRKGNYGKIIEELVKK